LTNSKCAYKLNKFTVSQFAEDKGPAELVLLGKEDVDWVQEGGKASTTASAMQSRRKQNFSKHVISIVSLSLSISLEERRRGLMFEGLFLSLL
jgi:hypothetical protein